MAFEDEYLELMPQTVLIEKWTGQDQYGQPTYGVAVPVRARVVGRNRIVRTTEGQEVVSNRTVYLAGAPGVGPKDRVTLPNWDPTLTSPPILSVIQNPDEAGNHHEVLYL